MVRFAPYGDLVASDAYWKLGYRALLSGIFGPILWGHRGPLCHALSLLSSSSSLLWTSTRRRRATVATPGEWKCGMRWLAVANGPNCPTFFKCFLLLPETAKKLLGYKMHLFILHKSQTVYVYMHDDNIGTHIHIHYAVTTSYVTCVCISIAFSLMQIDSDLLL